MTTRELIEAYYKYANAGEWDKWCNLFAEDMVMDEQLAGHIETLKSLRPMIDGMGQAYAKFHNEPKHIIVDGNEVAVVSHISAIVAKSPDVPVECGVMNYFRIKNGKIAYMSNYHDSKPFEQLQDKSTDKIVEY